jgi:putative addiction module component (TIGR02574 family)
MNMDIEKLLLLSSEEKRLIAETLWDSLLSEDENEGLTEEEMQLLQQRWNALQNGETNLHNWEEVRARIIPSP